MLTRLLPQFKFATRAGSTKVRCILAPKRKWLVNWRPHESNSLYWRFSFAVSLSVALPLWGRPVHRPGPRSQTERNNISAVFSTEFLFWRQIEKWPQRSRVRSDYSWNCSLGFFSWYHCGNPLWFFLTTAEIVPAAFWWHQCGNP